MRILIADDDAVSRRLLERTLVRLGHDVIAKTNGTDAIEGLLADDAPRLAVLDWMMPGADGLTVCRTVRTRPHTAPYVYIILLTARDGRDDMVEALDAEVDDFLIKPFHAMELRARLRSGERVLALQKSLLETQEALRHQATHDNLTGLWNRGLILESLQRALAQAHRSGAPVSVVMADLDHFKRTNDTHGHAAGDAILRQAAQRIRSGIRQGDMVGRYGGEEFLLVLPGADTETARVVAERVRAAIDDVPMILDDGRPLPSTVSMGLASAIDMGYEAIELLLAADAALYRAKANGRNRVEIACILPDIEAKGA
jgi:diguanylate cyclase (GGDEF)-like protein